jgi:alpha-ketoglutarate-dependent taurine dioxygenase
MNEEIAVSFANSSPNHSIPLFVRPTKPGVSLMEWIREYSETVEKNIREVGAILFRGFEVNGQAEFEAVFDYLFGQKLDYVYRTTPRTQVGKGVYTATEYPPRVTIPFHNENSYQRDWPMRLAFFCVKPAEEGGETPIAHSVRVTARIARAIRDKFERKKVMYVRNYRPGFDIPWQAVFQTENKEEVEAYCQQHGISCQWKGNNWFRTEQICHAIAVHPRTRQAIWFNQAHLFHVSSLDERTRRGLLSIYGEEGLPRNAYYGDGVPIEEDALTNIREAYQAESNVFQWCAKDLLLLDNMLIAHSRNPYHGERKILVSMATPYSVAAREPSSDLTTESRMSA